MRIGFTGLGIMGRPMCRDLLGAGHELVVRSHNAAGAAEQIDLVITMLPNFPQLSEVSEQLAKTMVTRRQS